MDKAQARERRDRLLESAATAKLSLTEGVREMRAIASMTQEEFAEHRGVSPRVIKAIELDQGNPTVATLNRIGEFFGLEVGFVPIRQPTPLTSETTIAKEPPAHVFANDNVAKYIEVMNRQVTPAFDKAIKENLQKALERELVNALSAPNIQRQLFEYLQNAFSTTDKPVDTPSTEQALTTADGPARKKRKPGLS